MAASKITDDDKLKRLLYLGNLEPKYISGGPDKYVPFSNAKKELLDEYVKNAHGVLIGIVIDANGDEFLPHRATVFQILSYVVTCEAATADVKAEISSIVVNICKSDKELFHFIKYVSTLRVNKSRLPKTVCKLVRKYYAKKSADELMHSYTQYIRYHSWSHKDLIKLTHLKPETPLKGIIVNYILFKKPPTMELDIDAEKAISTMRKADILRSTTDHKVAVPIILQLRATIGQVEPSLRKSAEVWEAVLPFMPLEEVMQVLPKLYKLGFLKKDSLIHSRIEKILRDHRIVINSEIHPLEVFIHIKNFEKGGKPLDPKLLHHLVKEKKLTEEELKKLKTPSEIKCPAILKSFQTCLDISCDNLPSCGKRYMITIDVTDRMDSPCLHNRNISSLEAAVALTISLMHVEEDVTVAVYKEKEISIIQLDKNWKLNEHIQKLKENRSNYLIPSAPIDWALAQEKHFDIFINFIHHKDYYTFIPKDIRDKLEKPADVFHAYKKKFNLCTKLITLSMASPHLTFADGSPHILDIAGLDAGVSKLIQAFCKGNFL